jgi:hypothetical protein
MARINDDELVKTQMNNQVLKQDLHRANLAYYDMEEELKFHAAKAKELQEMVDSFSLSCESQVQQKLVQKSIQYAELNQVNDNLRDKLQEAEGKNRLMEEEREATQELMVELHGIVHSLQRRLGGSNNNAMEDEQLLTVENGVIMTSKVRMQIQQIENERDEYKQHCLQWKRELDVCIAKGRDREVRNNISLRSMKFQMDEAEECNELLSQKCEAMTQVMDALEGEKELQQEKIDALETHFQMFNTTRLKGGIPQVQTEDLSLRDNNFRLPVDVSRDTEHKKSLGPSEETEDTMSREHEEAVRDKPGDEAKEIVRYIHSGLSILETESTSSTEIPSDSSTISSRDVLVLERKQKEHAWRGQDQLGPPEEEHAWREDRLDLPNHIQPSSSYFHSGPNNKLELLNYLADDTDSTSSDTASLPSEVYGRIEI